MPRKTQDADRRDAVQAEYAALSSYFNNLIGFRLTLLGFYVAAIGLIVSSHWPVPIPLSILGIILSVALYLFELRTRVIYTHLGARGTELEMEDWDYKSHSKSVLPFFSRQFPMQVKDKYNTAILDVSYDMRILGFIRFRPKYDSRLISHSLALDILYLGAIAFFAYSLVIA